jgi:hypothetical protein
VTTVLTAGQLEVLARALADAIAFRLPDWCVDCAADPDGQCCDHLADETLACAYQALGRELGVGIPS